MAQVAGTARSGSGSIFMCNPGHRLGPRYETGPAFDENSLLDGVHRVVVERGHLL